MPKTVAKKPETKRERYTKLKGQLEAERSSFIEHWRELGNYILPRRPRFIVSDTNKGEKRNTFINDSTATESCDTLTSGMMAYHTSPARPWFRLTTPDPDLAEVGAVKEWLHKVNQRMLQIYQRSNLYSSLPIFYQDLVTFATAAMWIEMDRQKVIHTEVFPIGSYSIATDDKGRVRIFFREFRMTVRQLVDKFGRKNPGDEIDWSVFSDFVKQHYEDGELDVWVDVCHVVQPNEDHDDRYFESRYKEFSSCYYESGHISGSKDTYLKKGRDDDRYLREAGYDYFPVLVARWQVTGEDWWGTSCPGMKSLPDVKQLQTMEKRALQAIEKVVNPPLKANPALKKEKVSLLPGDITYLESMNDRLGLEPILEVNPHVKEIEDKEEQVRTRIRNAFLVKAILALAYDVRTQPPTAEEVRQRQTEGMLMLSPALERLNQEVYDPLIDITFDIMLLLELVPEWPEELEGVPLRVQYTSAMAMAVKASSLSSLDRIGNVVLQFGAVRVDAWDKLDVDQLLDEYSEALGLPPRVIRTDEDTEKIRRGRAQIQAAQQRAEMVPPMAKAAKDLSETDMTKDSALKRVAAMVAGQGGNGNPAPAAA